jgi:ParB family chromosome partitioning protein
MPKPKRSGLGKGLDTLIPEIIDTDENYDDKPVILLKTSQIEPNREQPRKEFNQEALEELAESIKQYGVLQPLLVQKRDDYYELIAGERRWRAAKLAGLKEVPVIVKNYTEQEIIEISLIENIQRENLNPIEEALAYKRLINEFNLKQEEIAERVSKSRTFVTNTMRLLKLADEVKDMVISGEISSGHARAILAIEDTQLQHKIAKKIAENNLSVRETEKLIKNLLTPKNKKPIKKADNELIYKEIERNIENIIGTKVRLNQKNQGTGKIEIEFYSKEELDRICELLMTIQG